MNASFVMCKAVTDYNDREKLNAYAVCKLIESYANRILFKSLVHANLTS